MCIRDSDRAAALLIQTRGGVSKLVRLLAQKDTAVESLEPLRPVYLYPTVATSELHLSLPCPVSYTHLDVYKRQINDHLNADGHLTLGENIADQGGLLVSYLALQKQLQGKKVDKIDGFTPAQRFFIGYARVWGQNITPEEEVRLTKIDPHSLGINRVNQALKNIDAFYEAFNLQPGDPMYIACLLYTSCPILLSVDPLEGSPVAPLGINLRPYQPPRSAEQSTLALHPVACRDL